MEWNFANLQTENSRCGAVKKTDFETINLISKNDMILSICEDKSRDAEELLHA